MTPGQQLRANILGYLLGLAAFGVIYGVYSLAVG